jgi:hypothetical protein
MTTLPARDEFASCLGSGFRVVDPSLDPFDLELVQVSDLKTTPEQQNFSILFLGPAEHFMPQSIHRLAHDRLGELDLFLVPIGQQGETILYQAVFNHLTRSN